jgi:hypothetical protein
MVSALIFCLFVAHDRETTINDARSNCLSKKEVIGMLTSGETQVLAELVGEGWSLMNSNWSLQLQKKLSEYGHIFELTGIQKVSIFFSFIFSS